MILGTVSIKYTQKSHLIRELPYERHLVVDGVVDVALPLDVDQDDLGAVGLGVDLPDADAVLELLHGDPVLEEEVGDAAHVRTQDEEVGGEGVAAEHVVLPGLGEHSRLALLLLFRHQSVGQICSLSLGLSE